MRFRVSLYIHIERKKKVEKSLARVIKLLRQLDVRLILKIQLL